MAQVDYRPLEFATELLKARLAQRVPIGVNLIEPATAEAPANLNDHPGNFVGFFFWLENGDPSFVWLSRNVPPMFGFSHVHIHYLNRKLKAVPEEDARRFSRKKLAPHVKFCAVNLIAPNVPKFMAISVLIQALEETLKTGRLDLEQTHHVGLALDCYLSGIPHAPLPPVSCEATRGNRESQFKTIIMNMGYNWAEIDLFDDDTTVSPDFDVLQVNTTQFGRCGSHYVYGIHYKAIKVLMLLICHPYIFHEPSHRQPVTGAILKALGSYKLKLIGATRYYRPDSEAFCHSDEVIKACLVALKYPLVVVKSSDVEHLYDDEYFISRWPTIGPRSEPQFSASIASTQVSNVDDTNVYHWISCSLSGESEVIRPGSANMSVASSRVSTQAINVFSPREVRSAISSFNEQIGSQQELPEVPVPPIVQVGPYDDIRNTFLDSEDLFISCLQSHVNLWRAFVTVRIYERIPLIQVANSQMAFCEERFAVLPILTGELTLVLIYDTLERYWAYMNPYFDRESPLEPALRVVQRDMPGITNMVCRPINLTSYFHRRYTRIHVLMGLYHIGRLFRYALRLPLRVFYLERDFRRFCWSLCHALQVANAEYNLSAGLVNDNGYLLPGAMRSKGSPVCYEAAVVSIRQECPFCSERGWNKLENHMRMKHGGQARRARMARGTSEQDD